MFAIEGKVEEEGISASSGILKLLIIGLVLVFSGIVVLVVVSLVFAGSGSASVVIFLGPIPIVIGAGPDAVWLILIGLIIAVLSLVFFIIMNRRLGKFMA